jgi:hypothetical protein
MEPVQRATERLVQIAQVIRQHQHKPKPLCRFQVKIRQYVERQVQLFVQSARVSFEFGSERHNERSKRLDLGIDFL